MRTQKLHMLAIATLASLDCGSKEALMSPRTATQDQAIQLLVNDAGKVDSNIEVGEHEVGKLPTSTINTPQARFVCSKREISIAKQPDTFTATNAYADVLYAGSLIQGRSFSSGILDPIPVSRAPASVVLALATGSSSSITERVPSATLANVLDAQNRILSRYDGGNPAIFYYEMMSAHSFQQLAINANVNVKGAGWDVGAALVSSNEDEKNRVMVRFIQSYYTITIDPPQGAAGVFAPEVREKDLLPYVNAGNPPLYVASVTYGRVFYLLFESSSSTSDLYASVNASVNLGISGSGMLSVKNKNIMNSTSIKAYALGGDAAQAIEAATGASLELINNGNRKSESVGKIADFLRSGAKFGKNSPGVPISYTVRYLGDSSLVRIALATEYVEKNCRQITTCVSMGQAGIEDECGVCNGDGTSCQVPCKPIIETHCEPNNAFAKYYLPRIGGGDAAPGTEISFKDGVGHGNDNLCRRISWFGVRFKCEGGNWLPALPAFTNDIWCHGSVNDGPDNNVTVGVDQSLCRSQPMDRPFFP